MRRWDLGRLRLESAPGGTRTHDLRVKSPLLYQLSYRRPNLLAAETYKYR
jgi:hypothetical protein